MNLKAYANLCRQQSTQWLRDCLADPSAHMRRVHLAIIRHVLKERGAK